MTPVLLAFLLGIAGTTSAAPHYCEIAAQSKNVNLPPERTDTATNIAHASLVLVRGAFTGFLYRTNAGAVWYQDGLIGRRNSAGPRSSAAVLTALDLNLAHVGVGILSRVPASLLAHLIDGEIAVTPCY